MSTGEEGDTNTARIEKEAVAWFTRMNGRPSVTDNRDFAQWLASSEAHERAYEEVRALWSHLGAAAGALDERAATALAGAMEKIGEMRRKRRAGKIASGIALCLAALLTGAWMWLEHPTFLQDLRADYVSPRGDVRSIALTDGSTLLLDADTAVDVDMTARTRHVTVLRGTVFFTIQRSEVPFVVTARNGEARVLGTAFEVGLREDEDVVVTLETGSVQVGLTDRKQDLVLRPGESVEYGASGLGVPRMVDVEEATAWRRGRFIFTNARLADVAERIGRYRDGRIVVLGSALADTRVSGNISLRDTDAALAAVRSSVGFPMHRLGKLTLIGP